MLENLQVSIFFMGGWKISGPFQLQERKPSGDAKSEKWYTSVDWLTHRSLVKMRWVGDSIDSHHHHTCNSCAGSICIRKGQWYLAAILWRIAAGILNDWPAFYMQKVAHSGSHTHCKTITSDFELFLLAGSSHLRQQPDLCNLSKNQMCILLQASAADLIYDANLAKVSVCVCVLESLTLQMFQPDMVGYRSAWYNPGCSHSQSLIPLHSLSTKLGCDRVDHVHLLPASLHFKQDIPFLTETDN